MQEPLFPTTISRKLYNERSILIGTFIGGPLAGGYLIAQNFKALNDPAKAVKTWIVTILVLLLTMATAFVPALDKLPTFFYSFIFCMIAHFMAKKFQGSNIQLHQVSGGQLYNTWRAVAAGVIFMLLMVAFILVISYLQDPSVFK
ncbi:MAG: hypothetical protein JWR72_661 [Flavisolibacter sp.]|jgi:hypothetical protein|nr:hypothetical protein [Flavisolibacter sp.]